MAASDGDIRERLSVLWGQWGLEPELSMSEAQYRALDAAAAWLEGGQTNPEIAIRAVQVLLADPEQTGVHKRPSWAPLRAALRDAWANVGALSEHVFYAQALLLAAWPDPSERSQLRLADLVGSAWTVVRGRPNQQRGIAEWRVQLTERKKITSHRTPDEDVSEEEDEEDVGGSTGQSATITEFFGLSLELKSNAVQVAQQHLQNQQFPQAATTLSTILAQYRMGIETLNDALSRLSREMVSYVDRQLSIPQSELNLLWWGQARYCHTLGKPYRRLAIESAEAALWWAAYEAARLSRTLETEPAAAYLVETLHSLDQDVFERRSLREWLEGTHAVLQNAGKVAPAVSERLAAITDGDALGLPVTWTRLRAARKEPITGADEAVALNLDTQIDRGEWASWIFREVLLDLHLADES